ncbi:aminodeoxychorismate lyase [Neoasaia chiangmaiensis NBRC 101099]|uniref:Endolytic murein transglycosylase n=1 Tax=Neoasaia chiangmaiensis TaxID=320497 RepID=A0A1U9KSS3_9PROT|nr:endolytic transglycosylase MltG [Neoasaia chiangmaiensis]AQS88812.1 hypothetical protein A0U93_13740 [Neoasaia chiangmaiensis]GBR40714.1 aminodeoxychorismate lyase [Neoasaia chiangmaiensis NBRC 101099]GEN13775.1 hypothetical protein NCH01_02060 [Neoasaia chiangmaiensis]
MTRRQRGLSWIVLVIVLGIGFIGGGWWIFLQTGPLSAPHDVVVRRGDTSAVLRGLQDAGVMRRDLPDNVVFRLAVLATRSEGPLHAAELAFPAGSSIRQTIWILRHAPPVEHRLTIPEGLTARRMAGLLGNAPALGGPVPAIAEGSILPETVSYTYGTSRAAIVRRLQHMMDQTLDDVWQHRDPRVTLADPRSMLILASIVERETGLPDERPQVAQVFLNRLARGMRLQSDPTVIYDVSAGWGELDRPLDHADLAEDGPANTYRLPGLPPMPICSPGRAALEAVAHPASGDALYFVASGLGGHRFATTLDDHNRNIDAYHASRVPGR